MVTGSVSSGEGVAVDGVGLVVGVGPGWVQGRGGARTDSGRTTVRFVQGVQVSECLKIFLRSVAQYWAGTEKHNYEKNLDTLDYLDMHRMPRGRDVQGVKTPWTYLLSLDTLLTAHASRRPHATPSSL